MFGAHGSATPGHSRPHSRPLRLTNYAPKSQTNLPANFYPSNNTLIQALLVLLITNMISMGKTWSGLLKLCAASSSSPPLSKLSLPSSSSFAESIFYFKPKETIISIIVYFSLKSKVDSAKEEEEERDGGEL